MRTFAAERTAATLTVLVTCASLCGRTFDYFDALCTRLARQIAAAHLTEWASEPPRRRTHRRVGSNRSLHLRRVSGAYPAARRLRSS